MKPAYYVEERLKKSSSCGRLNPVAVSPVEDSYEVVLSSDRKKSILRRQEYSLGDP